MPRSRARLASPTAGSRRVGSDQCAAGIEKTKAAWADAGRDDEPRQRRWRISLGDRAEEEARAYLTDYYAWLGEQIAEFLVTSAAKDTETVKQFVAAYEATGCDELILFPSWVIRIR